MALTLSGLLTKHSPGSPLSPLLSNIVLDEQDKELERPGHFFVCYDDDCEVLCAKPEDGNTGDAIDQLLYRKQALGQ